MVIGLTQFLLAQKNFEKRGECHHYDDCENNSVNTSLNQRSDAAVPPPLTRAEWNRITVVFILFAFTVVFGTVSEQAGSSMNLFADRLTRTQILGWEFPSSWFQAAVPVFVIILSPLVSRLWLHMGDRQPSSPTKFSLSLVFAGAAFGVMTLAALAAKDGEVSPFWLLGAFFLQEIGAVLLNPTGLSVVTKLSPLRFVGVMMGVWFLASAVASRIAGYLAGFFDENNTEFLVQYFGGLACVLILAASILALCTPHIRRMMGGVK